MNTTNISFSELVKAVSNGKSYIKKHFDIDNTFYTTTIKVNEFKLDTYQNEVAVFKHIPTGAQKISLEKAQNLIRALVSKKNVKKAYDEWESVQSGPYWYQGYSRKEKLGYEVEMALIVGMSKYLELNIENCYKTANLSYDLLKTKFLNKAFEKEILTRFKK